MENILRPIYQERASHSNTQGIIMLEKSKPESPATDNFDVILFVVVKEFEATNNMKHYQLQSGKKAALKIVDIKQLNNWLEIGSNRRVFDWIMNGKILFERNEYLTNLKQTLTDFPLKQRKKRIGLEFAKLIRRYVDGKELFELGNFLDAYNHVVHALHHLARLSIIDNGLHPEITVWNQVRRIEPEIFTLYHELVESEEPIHKKLELLFLASEFLVNQNIKIGAIHLIETMSEKKIWTIQELSSHPELFDYGIDFEALLEFLIEKKVVRISLEETKGQGIYHRKYMIN